MNNLLLVVAIVLTFSTLLLFKKILGNAGVIGFMGIATIMANILICKSVTLFGISATLGNVMFASNFLATDILTESGGVKEARKGILFAVCAIVTFMCGTQIALTFTPNEFDIANDSMKTLFALTPRITAASVSLFIISNIVDVTLYDYLKKRTDGKYMWLRNNISTIASNCTENFIFYFIAFYGIYSVKEIISFGISASIIEFIIALCDTPFLYISTRISEKGIIKNTVNQRSELTA